MTWRPDWVLIGKKRRTCPILDLAISADHRVKIKESKKIDKYKDLARESKKLCTSCRWCPLNSPQRPWKETEETEDQWKSQDNEDPKTVKISLYA